MAYLQENYALATELISRAKSEYERLQSRENKEVIKNYQHQLNVLDLLELKIILRSNAINKGKLSNVENKFWRLLNNNLNTYASTELDSNDMPLSIMEEDFFSKAARIELAYAWLKLAAQEAAKTEKQYAIAKAKNLLTYEQNAQATMTTSLLEKQRQMILAIDPHADLQTRTLELARYNGDAAIARQDPTILSDMSGLKDYLSANHPAFFDTDNHGLNQKDRNGWIKIGIVKMDDSGKIIFKAYYNKNKSELLLVFRGKEPGIELFTELTLYKNDGLPIHLAAAEQYLKRVLKSIKKQHADTSHIRLVLTGYSDGALLAECLLAKLTCDKELQNELQNQVSYPVIETQEAVTFDSPGSKRILVNAFPELAAHPQSLNITAILTPPSLINIWGGHLGKVIQVNIPIEVQNQGNGFVNFPWYALDPSSFLYSRGLPFLVIKNGTDLLYKTLVDSTGQLLSVFGLWAASVWLQKVYSNENINSVIGLLSNVTASFKKNDMSTSDKSDSVTITNISLHPLKLQPNIPTWTLYAKGFMYLVPSLWLSHLIYYGYTRTYTFHSFNLLYQQFIVQKNSTHAAQYTHLGMSRILGWPSSYDALRAYDYGRKQLQHSQQPDTQKYYQHLIDYAGYKVGETDEVLHEIDRHELPPALWDLLIKKYFKGKDELNLDPRIIQFKIANDKIYILNDYPADSIKSYLMTMYLNRLNMQRSPAPNPSADGIKPILSRSIFSDLTPFSDLGIGAQKNDELNNAQEAPLPVVATERSPPRNC